MNRPTFVLGPMLAALAAGILAGRLDAATVWSRAGSVWVYGSFVWIMLVATIAGLLTFVRSEGSGWLRLAEAAAILPVALVALDASSLLFRGLAPASSTGYQQLFGANRLTLPVLGLPGWYWASAAWGGFVTLVRAIPAGSLGSSRPTRAT